jgi:hypothetical protein
MAYPRNRYVLGDHKRSCDVCGFDYLRSELKLRWDGAIVCDKDWRPKPPQEDGFIIPTRVPPTLNVHDSSPDSFVVSDVWSSTLDFSVRDTPNFDFLYLHSAGSGTCVQTVANFRVSPVASTLYEFSYKISGIVGNPTCIIDSSGDGIAVANASLTMTNGVHITQFTTKAGSLTALEFLLTGGSDSADDTFTIDHPYLSEALTDTKGANLLALF